MSVKLTEKTQITAKDLEILKAVDINITSFTKIRHFKDCLYFAVFLGLKHRDDIGDSSLDYLYQLYQFLQDLEAILEKYPKSEPCFLYANVEDQEEAVKLLLSKERSVGND